MSTEQRNEEAIFKAAVKLRSSAARTAYVQQACGSDADLLARIETLLHAHDSAGDFLESPPFDTGAVSESSSMTEGPGTVIGRYKLLEKIGEGGMAVVYMAEQTEPLRRKVALKIIKLGMDTRQVIARFEAERQALALMDHPNIAKVLDAGSTETGRPYFVMELVTGVSITEYCDKNRLSTKERLALFLLVCQAVQHAHTKGIIHRDIKPSNVMVTHHDGQPIPKVIDFGIAKATNQKLTEKTLFTRYAHIIGTPAYMSPEQAELSDLDIDTRSDIYSLGVLLYELLTGATPFSEEELRKAGYLEMQRVIREQEPVKPSTKLSTLGETVTDIAKCRNCTPDLLRKAIRGDLDWIVMKSLEKDRVRRYETTSSLAEDIRRHLEHEPVLARGPGMTYRLGRFLRRHRSQALVALVMLVAAMAAGVLLSRWSRDRQQLAAAEGPLHEAILSRAQGQYASGDREGALTTIQPILSSPHVGGKAQLLRAGILVDNRHPDEAVTVLNGLLDERREIAGAAHALLARILCESGPLDTEKLKELEEHRRQAELLLPETAEAYFLRAMTAITIKEQLAALNKALQLAARDPDSRHSVSYEALRLRAFTYYASRKYEKMRDDALVMATLRPRDPLGYSLRATALRELGKYADAITEYDNAMAFTDKDDPQYLSLAILRCETFLRMSDYQRAVAEAQACRRLWPDKPVFQHHIFSALTALGDYDQAAALFRQIAGAGQDARRQFERWCVKYVLEALTAGRPCHPADRELDGAAFLPMVEAEKTYRDLSAKARCVTTEGFSAEWSPDGTKLAFSLGVRGDSGVAIFDLATRETELLIIPGMYPRWSPDGRYIAFVRDRQFVGVPEFVASGPANQPPLRTDEEVWLMESDGTEPRRLVRGGWPSWSRDSTSIYYYARPGGTLNSVSIADPSAQPQRITGCPGVLPSVASDNRYVAYLSVSDLSLQVQDLATHTVIAAGPLPTPSDAWGRPAWSPAGDELCLGGGGSLQGKTGLWIYRLDGSTPARILSGQIRCGSWSPDGTKFAFEFGAPCFSIWTADITPQVSAAETLGPARTLEDHWRDLIAFQTRRIEADPADAQNYLQRAGLYQLLHQPAQSRADIGRCRAILRQGFFADPKSHGPWTFTHSFDGPAGRQLVVFVERQENGVHLLRIAFGQKGECKMKSLEIPIVAASLLSFCFLPTLDESRAKANFTFGKPASLGPMVNTGAGSYGACLSPDGLELYFHKDPGEIWVVRRASPEDEWGPAANLGPPINSAYIDGGLCLSGDGLTLYFSSDRVGGFGSMDLWMATRATVKDNWAPPVNLGPTINRGDDWAPSITADGLELYFTSDQSGSYGGWDIWVTTRVSTSDAWGPPVNLGPDINTSAQENWPGISPDGLVLFFGSSRPGGSGSWEIYMARRANRQDPWGPAVNVGPVVNSATWEVGGHVTPDGSAFYFQSPRSGGFSSCDSWQAPIVPVVDFNGDGKVDEKDLALLVADWGKGNSVCDIGPFPWGDGVVDEKDLAVLMKELLGTTSPLPHAAEIPRDVILSWTAVPSAQGYDVYFGTSAGVVKNASRGDPLGALVSLEQPATTYDPNGLLEFSQTYYWRIDAVIPGPTPVICQGPVLSFTTEPFAYPIKNILVAASSAQRGNGPERTIGGSGLDQNDGHSTTVGDMWVTKNAPPAWIQYEFDKVYTLHELWVWNFNRAGEPDLGFGARNVEIFYSVDGTTWTPLADVPEFAQAPGESGYKANTVVSFGGVSAKFVKLTIKEAWGEVPYTGLSEVRFFYIPDRPAGQP